jgi:AAA lid domain
MTNKSKRFKTKAKPRLEIKEFELDEEFKTKYPDITTIYTMGKALIVEHYTGALIQSSYYDDDSMKTVNNLGKALEEHHAIKPEFDKDGFLKSFGQLMVRRMLREAKEETEDEAKAQKEVEEERQQKDEIQQAIDQLRQHHQNITTEEWTRTLQVKFQNLQDVVKKKMPEIWPGLEFELSVSRILNIGGCTLPFIGILLGRPSSYKTVIIELLKPWRNTYYTDNFTARSFVSHSTSVEPEYLEDIDMLPKMKDNVFLTPELSPMFTSKEDDLVQALGIITRIADGHGYGSDSGAHGHRGYDYDIMFPWVAAAVDIPYKVYKILNNLGHRLYYYRLHFRDESLDDLIEYAAEQEDFNVKKAMIQDALFDYLKWFEIGNFELEPDANNNNKKVKWDCSRNDREAIKIIAGMGDLLSYLRCVAKVYITDDSQGSNYSYTISPREVPRRAIKVLTNLAKAHAILNGRNYITMDDIPIVVKTATDSAQVERVSLFSLLIANKGKITTSQILESLTVARKTALRTMTEFHTIGLASIEDFHEEGYNNMSKRMVLNPRFDWLLENPMITKIFPHTTPSQKDSQREDQEEGEVTNAILFWIICNQLETQNGNGKVINHDELHEALIATGKFYGGEATQITEDMVNAGRLEAISFHEYKKTG